MTLSVFHEAGTRRPLGLRLWAWWYCHVEYSANPAVRWVGRRVYVARRRLQGARSTDIESDTCGRYDARGISLEFGGACPVQGEGILDGRACYYRSRGEGWQFHVAAEGSDDVFAADAWTYSERPYIFPDGGWVSADVSRACIAKAVALLRAEAA